jgi:hypothetical protein
VTLAGAYALGAFDHPTPATSDQVSLVAVPTRASFPLQVLNGSGRSGIAATAAHAFTTAGFHVTVVGNAPEHLWHDHSAVVRCGPDGLGGARLVAAQIPGSVLLEDERLGSGVEVVLGTAFQPPTPPGTTPPKTSPGA